MYILLFVLFDQAMWLVTGLVAHVSVPWQGSSVLWRLVLCVLVMGWRINRRQRRWLWLAVRGVSWYALVYGVLVAAAAHYALPSAESLQLPDNVLGFWTRIPPQRVWAYPVVCVVYLAVASRILPRL